MSDRSFRARRPWICREYGVAGLERLFGSRPPFADRRDAGRALSLRLETYRNRSDVVVLALPRGGVPVAYEVARELQAPLDVFVVRKLGLPGHRELAMGAIASGGIRLLNEDVVGWYHVPAEVIEQVAEEEQRELERREISYRAGRPSLVLRDRVVILVDDGLATASTMKAAVKAAARITPQSRRGDVPRAPPRTRSRIRLPC
jgi:putative phosphoribosyl transferase